VVDVAGQTIPALPIPGLRERKKQRTRAMLIDAAIELCDRQGFEHTTVDQIAAVADVSPRTFSRYFATKDAVILALIDEVVDAVGVELQCQPAHLSDLEALRAAHLGVFRTATSAPTGTLTPERLLAIARIVNSSPSLRQAVHDFSANTASRALAQRMGVGVDDRRLRLVAAVWSAIVMTAVSDLGPSTDWEKIGVDGIVARVEDTFDQFIDLMAGLRLPV
jgi:AcrR family transcriptional regulator